MAIKATSCSEGLVPVAACQILLDTSRNSVAWGCELCRNCNFFVAKISELCNVCRSFIMPHGPCATWRCRATQFVMSWAWLTGPIETA